jgi:DNA invertase Pin-like site-specific DNA recombinase
MRGSRSRKGAGRRGGGGRSTPPSRQPSTPSERQEAADRAQSLRRAGEELVPAAKMAKALGLSLEAVRQAIAEIEIQPDHVLDGCAYYSQATARRIREHLKG